MSVLPNPERTKAAQKINGWFASLEERRPDLVGKIVPIITQLIGTQDLTPEKIEGFEPFISAGFKMFSSWLSENGFPPLNLKLGAIEDVATDTMIVAYKATHEAIPNKSVLYSRGEIDNVIAPKVDGEIKYLVDSVNYALGFGFKPKNILGGLLHFSTLPNSPTGKNPLTCVALRNILIKTMPGNLNKLSQITHRLANS